MVIKASRKSSRVIQDFANTPKVEFKSGSKVNPKGSDELKTTSGVYLKLVTKNSGSFYRDKSSRVVVPSTSGSRVTDKRPGRRFIFCSCGR